MNPELDTVTILFLGDVYPGGAVPQVDPALAAVASEADVVMANVESPLSSGGTRTGDRAAHLRSDPGAVDLLEGLSVNVACLANNHVMDWGPEALRDTIDLLDERGIRHVGAGGNRQEAERPLLLTVGGMKLAVLAFGWEKIGTVGAGDDSYGSAALDPERAVEATRTMAAEADAVVIQLHWGYTNYHYPLPEHLELGRRLVDAGALLVVGHHPHVVQGYERRASGAVLYSLGNLFFTPYKRGRGEVPLSRENRTSAVARAEVRAGAVQSLEFLHTRQCEQEIELLAAAASDRRARFLRRLSAPLGDASYPRFFRTYVVRRLGRRIMYWMAPRNWGGLHRSQLAGLWSALRRIAGRR